MNDQRPAFGEAFNPHRQYRTGVWVPEGLMSYANLSAGAKLYGQLLRHAGENGRCFPKKRHLAIALGVDERTVQRYISELADNHEGYPFIRREQPRAGVSPNDYAFVRHPLLSGETDMTPVGKTNLSPQGSQFCPPQESNRKSSSTREKNTTSVRNASSVLDAPKGQPELSRPNNQIHAAVPSHQCLNTSQSVDDDEAKTHPRQRNANAETEFLLRLGERHPNVDRTYIVNAVKKALWKNGMSMTEYLAEDDKRTTNPKALNQIPGYYVGMVKKIAEDVKRAAKERLWSNSLGERTVANEQASSQANKCPECRCEMGRGLKLEGSKITLCQCATDEFRAEYETKERDRVARQAEIRQDRDQEPNVSDAQAQAVSERPTPLAPLRPTREKHLHRGPVSRIASDLRVAASGFG